MATDKWETGCTFIAAHEANLLAQQFQSLVKELESTDGSTVRKLQVRHGTVVTLLMELAPKLVEVTGRLADDLADLPDEVELREGAA